MSRETWATSRGKSVMGLAVASLVVSLLLTATACAGSTPSTSASTTVTAQTTTTTAATTTTTKLTTTITELTTTTAELITTTTRLTISVSSESLAYAKSLGGTSHQGETLYFVIGASVETEGEAQTLLEGAKAVGDMQSYFIVQRSDNFEGMSPGWWVVFEAYRDYPSPENIAFGRRPFPGAYVKSATVRTSDPIPVYEDMVGL